MFAAECSMNQFAWAGTSFTVNVGCSVLVLSTWDNQQAHVTTEAVRNLLISDADCRCNPQGVVTVAEVWGVNAPVTFHISEHFSNITMFTLPFSISRWTHLWLNFGYHILTLQCLRSTCIADMSGEAAERNRCLEDKTFNVLTVFWTVHKQRLKPTINCLCSVKIVAPKAPKGQMFLQHLK